MRRLNLLLDGVGFSNEFETSPLELMELAARPPWADRITGHPDRAARSSTSRSVLYRALRPPDPVSQDRKDDNAFVRGLRHLANDKNPEKLCGHQLLGLRLENRAFDPKPIADGPLRGFIHIK